MAHRRGFTLIEVLIVIVVGGLLFLIGLPRLRDAVVRNNVYQSRVAVSGLYARARAVSIEQGRLGYLARNGNRLTVLVRLSPTGASWADTVGNVENLNERYGVTLTASNDTIRFDPRGFGLNDLTETLVVARDGIADTVTISPYGRIQQ